ncbi:MAG: hypothetical protein ACYDBY_01825 [Thermoanaerobaculia bacterium]
MKAARTLLFPWPPRPRRWGRPVQVALRAVHVAAMALVLGGLAFDVPDARLHAAGVVTVASGVGLLAVELARTGVFLYTGAGVASLLKLALLGLGFAFPVARFELYLAATLVASVASHMSGSWRHWSFLDRRTLNRD